MDMDTELLDPAISPYIGIVFWALLSLTILMLLRKYLGNIIEVFTNRYKTEEEFWTSLLTGNRPGVPMYFMRDFFGLFKCAHRCKVCNMPFDGVSSSIFKVLWSGQSNLTPDFCKKCEDFAKRHIGGAEIDITMLFVDIRGSTAISKRMTPREYRDLLNRFYVVATTILARHGAWIDQFVGDEAIGLFIPGFSGQDHASLAVKSARELLEATGHNSTDGPWVPLGIGINTGVVFIGTVESGISTNITAIGDEVNLTARLCSMAGAGEIIFSEASYNAVNASLFDDLDVAASKAKLKGIGDMVNVHVAKTKPSKVSEAPMTLNRGQIPTKGIGKTRQTQEG